MISHLGAMISVVNGVLFARRMKGITGIVGAACLGDGATSTGAFHEALNQAAVEKLPLIMVVADNQFAYSTPTNRQFACEDLSDKGVGYGIPTNNETMAFIWNAAIFEEAGLDPETPPATWDDVVTYSKTIKDKTGKDGFGLVARTNAGNIEHITGCGKTTAEYMTGNNKKTTCCKRCVTDEFSPRSIL